MKITEEMRKAVYVELASAGGKARAKKLTPARRREIAMKGGKARWAKKAKVA